MYSRKSVSLASALLFGFGMFAGCDSSDTEWGSDGWGSDKDEEASAPFSREVAVDGHTRLRLEGVNGTVNLSGSSSASTVKISGRRRVFADTKADAQSRLGNLEVQIDDLGDYVLVRSRQPKYSEGRTYVVDYEVEVPQDFDVEVVNINGKISLKDVAGNLSAYLTNGTIDCQSTLPIDQSVALSTTNGNISVQIPGSSSARIKASVVHGTISTEDLVLTNRSSSSRSLSGTLGDGAGLIDLSTINGDISVCGS
jgi:DUF4097 and DUF4098 domain-containing protein YvlB